MLPWSPIFIFRRFPRPHRKIKVNLFSSVDAFLLPRNKLGLTSTVYTYSSGLAVFDIHGSIVFSHQSLKTPAQGVLWMRKTNDKPGPRPYSSVQSLFWLCSDRYQSYSNRYETSTIFGIFSISISIMWGHPPMLSSTVKRLFMDGKHLKKRHTHSNSASMLLSSIFTGLLSSHTHNHSRHLLKVFFECGRLMTSLAPGPTPVYNL